MKLHQGYIYRYEYHIYRPGLLRVCYHLNKHYICTIMPHSNNITLAKRWFLVAPPRMLPVWSKRWVLSYIYFQRRIIIIYISYVEGIRGEKKDQHDRPINSSWRNWIEWLMNPLPPFASSCSVAARSVYVCVLYMHTYVHTSYIMSVHTSLPQSKHILEVHTYICYISSMALYDRRDVRHSQRGPA